jgi:putative transposase
MDLIVDNTCAHKHAKVGTWLNQVVRWFGIITQRAIRRSSFSRV